MKTFKQFLLESSTTQKLKIAVAKKIAATDDEVYKKLLKRIRERETQHDYPDYPGRQSARRDKNLIPSNRTSSFPKLAGVSTQTKNPRKLRKQKALKEIP